jgi:hypothetical protein
VSDGNLRTIFQKHLPEVHWQPIETWSTGQGVPDANGCLAGQEFWIENKLTDGWKVNFEPGQVAWAERRIRAGGRVLLAVRRKTNAGPRRGDACDELWLFNGSQSRAVSVDGLKGAKPLVIEGNGPAKWDWDTIRKVLTL